MAIRKNYYVVHKVKPGKLWAEVVELPEYTNLRFYVVKDESIVSMFAYPTYKEAKASADKSNAAWKEMDVQHDLKY